jgi:hypothetical protein
LDHPSARGGQAKDRNCLERESVGP